ncbi:MAG: hypothetical protein AAF383_07065 [Cyanobacteria bacterium P01_A01_bin.83]
MVEKITQTLIEKLKILFEEQDSPDESFLAFYDPGIPISAKELDFSLASNQSKLTPQENLIAYANFARLVNTIPRFDNRWSPSESILWNIYQTILTQAIIPLNTPSKEEQTKLLEARNFLYETKEITDASGTHIATVDSQNLANYRHYQQLFLQASSEYNAQRIAAEFSNNSEVINNWLMRKSDYEAKLNNAKKDWISLGKRWEVEEKFTIIDQITGRSPQIIWAQYKDEYEQSKLTNIDGSYFYETYFYPNNFYKVDAKDKWTKLTLNNKDDTYISKSADIFESNSSFEVIRVQIIRPWLNEGIFKSRAWRFPDETQFLSDGKESPKGSLPAYITSMILIRNFEDYAQSDNMRIIAFVCQKLAKSPNPDPSLAWLNAQNPLKWVGKTMSELKDNSYLLVGTSIVVGINNYTEIDLYKKREYRQYGIYQDPPLQKVGAKSSQGFSTSQSFTGGPEGWLVYSFDEEYNIVLYWQNFALGTTNKGCITFMPTSIKLTTENIKKSTLEDNIISEQSGFFCDATIGSGYQKAVFRYTIMPK